MRLIDDVRGAWKHYSTQALAAAASLQGVWIGLSDEIKADLPGWVHRLVAYTVFLVAACGLGGKFIDQSKPEDKP